MPRALGHLGTWAWAVYLTPRSPQEVDAYISSWLNPQLGKSPRKIEYPKNVLQLLDGGRVGKSKHFSGDFLSGDRLIGSNDDQALRIEMKTVEGIDFLVVERGGFNAAPDSDEIKETPKEWHCGYHIYIRR